MKEVNGKVYCKPCSSGSFNWATMKCEFSLVANGALLTGGTHGQYCQSQSTPETSPPGCHCDESVTEANSGDLAGYFDASKSYFGRGAIQVRSWNE
jgi:hypothetical protein